MAHAYRRQSGEHRVGLAALVSDQRHRRHRRHLGADPAVHLGARRRDRPLDAESGYRQGRRHGDRLQRVELHDVSGDPLRRPAVDGSGEHVGTDRNLAYRGHGVAMLQFLERIRQHSLGRLQRDDDRPGRLHVLVHERILRRQRAQRPDAHRRVQVLAMHARGQWRHCLRPGDHFRQRHTDQWGDGCAWQPHDNNER